MLNTFTIFTEDSFIFKCVSFIGKILDLFFRRLFFSHLAWEMKRKLKLLNFPSHQHELVPRFHIKNAYEFQTTRCTLPKARKRLAGIVFFRIDLRVQITRTRSRDGTDVL